MRTQTHFSTSEEIQDFLIQLLQPFLSEQNQIKTATCTKSHAETEQWSQDLITQLATQAKIYNAVYHFAEVIYEQSCYQCHEHIDFMQNTLLFKILQQGRHDLFSMQQKKDHPTPSMFSELLNPISEYPQQHLSSELAHSSDLNHAIDVHNLDEDMACEPHEDRQAVPLECTDLTQITQELPDEISVTHTHDSSPIDTDLPPTDTDTKVKKMPHFQMTNARVGQNYQARIKMQYPTVQDIYIHTENLRFSSDVGIQFEEDTQQFSGVPIQAGEFKIYFEYQVHEHETTWTSAEVTLIITADPRSLWQMNEPDANAPYPKAHSDHQHIQLENYQLLACSQRGRSHEHAGSFRDDDFFIRHLPDSDWSILIVADGAGSAPFSRQGSYLAVQHFATHVLDYLNSQQHDLNAQLEQWQVGQADATSQQVASRLGQQFQDVFYQAAQCAVNAIEAEATQQQCPTKAFATTLLATVVRQRNDCIFVSSFWIGDGAIAVYSKDKLRLMGKPDGGEFAGQTRFLDAQVIKQFGAQVNVGYFEHCEAVVLMTDGISDPIFETDAGLQNEQKWHDVWQDIQPALHSPQPEVALLEWSKFFSVGHHDDRTLALLWTQKPNLEPTLNDLDDQQMKDSPDLNIHPE